MTQAVWAIRQKINMSWGNQSLRSAPRMFISLCLVVVKNKISLWSVVCSAWKLWKNVMYMFVMLNAPGSEGCSWLRSSESLNDSEGFCVVLKKQKQKKCHVMYMFVMFNVPGSEGGSWLRSSESLNDSEGFCVVWCSSHN